MLITNVWIDNLQSEHAVGWSLQAVDWMCVFVWIFVLNFSPLVFGPWIPKGSRSWAGCCAPVPKPYIWWHAIIVQKLQKHSFILFFSSTYIYREDEVGRRTAVYCVLSFSWVSHFIRNNSRKWDLSCFRCCKMTVEMYSVHMIWWSL